MKHQVLENPVKNQTSSDLYLAAIACLTVTFYLTANILAVKAIIVGDLVLFDAGTITFPFAYMLGDTLTEIWGFQTARRVIWITFFCNALLIGFTSLGLLIPAPDYTPGVDAAYAQIFGYVPRIVAASLIAFLFGELSNAWMMEKIREKTGRKLLFVRTIGSSALGYVFDTAIFVLIAFGGTAPVRDLMSMIGVQYITKLGVEAIAGTPLAYALIACLRRRCTQSVLKSR